MKYLKACSLLAICANSEIQSTEDNMRSLDAIKQESVARSQTQPSYYQTDGLQVGEKQERKLSLCTSQSTVPIRNAISIIAESFSSQNDWRDRLRQDSIVEIRHIGTQFILDDKYGGDSAQSNSNSFSQIWRIRFVPNESNIVVLENVLWGNCLNYNRKLGFSKYNQQNISENQKWGLNWGGEENGNYYFEIYPCRASIMRLSVHEKLGLTLLSPDKNTKWCFSPIYPAHERGWFNKVIIDWGRMIAQRYGVDLENEEVLKNVFDPIIFDNDPIFEHTSIVHNRPQSGTIVNLTEDTIIIDRKETEEKQKAHQITFSNEASISQRQSKLTQKQNESHLNASYMKEKTKAASIHETLQNGIQENHEDTDSNMHRKDSSRNVINTKNLSSENSINIGTHISSGEENSVLQGQIREVGKSTSKTNSATKGKSHTSSHIDEKIKEIRNTTEDQNTNYTEDTDSRTHNIGGRIYAEASGGADIPFLAKAKAKAGGEGHYDYTNNQQKKTGNSHTRTTSHSEANTTRNTNNITDTSFTENTKTDYVENNSRNTDTQSRSQNITNNRADALDQHTRLGEIKGEELSKHEGATNTQEHIRKDLRSATSNQESSETRNGGTQIQNRYGMSSGASCQHQNSNGQDQEHRNHEGGTSSNRGQITYDVSAQFSIPPSTGNQFYHQRTIRYQKILQTKFYMLRGPLQFQFSRPIILNWGSERSDADRRIGKIWHIYPSTILQILPMPHVHFAHENGGECIYYGSQEQINEVQPFDGKIIQAEDY